MFWRFVRMHNKYIANFQCIDLSIFQWNSGLLRVSNPHLYVHLQVEAWNLSHKSNLIFDEWLPKERWWNQTLFSPQHCDWCRYQHRSQLCSEYLVMFLLLLLWPEIMRNHFIFSFYYKSLQIKVWCYLQLWFRNQVYTKPLVNVRKRRNSNRIL